MVLDHGEIQELSDPETLLSDTGSLFYSFAKKAQVCTQ